MLEWQQREEKQRRAYILKCAKMGHDPKSNHKCPDIDKRYPYVLNGMVYTKVAATLFFFFKSDGSDEVVSLYPKTLPASMAGHWQGNARGTWSSKPTLVMQAADAHDAIDQQENSEADAKRPPGQLVDREVQPIESNGSTLYGVVTAWKSRKKTFTVKYYKDIVTRKHASKKEEKTHEEILASLRYDVAPTANNDDGGRR